MSEFESNTNIIPPAPVPDSVLPIQISDIFAD